MHVRPNLDEFIKRLYESYNIFFYSLYEQDVINNIVSNLNIKDLITKSFYCSSFKDKEKDLDLKNIIFITDDSNDIYTPEKNTLIIEEYNGQVNDDVLIILCDDLQYLADIDSKDLRDNITVTQRRINRIINDRTKAKTQLSNK